MLSLIVEDDETSRMVLQRYLMPYGETRTASDGQDAVAAFADNLVRGEPFDLVCLDIMLPGMSGQQVLEEIREMEDQIVPAPVKTARVIMTTALSDKDNIMKALPRCDAYLVKPVQRGDLMFYLKKFGLVA
jgi:two-component system, chemotaxis family, chemotaxis protein CheY